jgi:hypothetical protein
MTPEQIIRQLLTDLKTEHGFTSDEQLAKHLDVSTVALWRWRRGDLDKSTRVLVPILWQRAAAAETEPATA